MRTSGAQTFGGVVKLGADTTLSGQGITLGSDVRSAGGNRSLTLNDSGMTTLAGAVGGTGSASDRLASLTTDAAGSTLISGASVSTVGTQTFNDAVALGADTSLAGVGITLANTLRSDGTARSLTLNDGGTTTLAGAVGGAGGDLAGLSVRADTLSAQTLTVSGPIDLTLANASAVDGVISGAGTRLSKSGAGRLVLSGSNSYTGTTTVAGGTLALTSDQALGIGGAVAVGPGASLELRNVQVAGHALTLDGATLLVSSGQGSVSGPVQLAGDSVMQVNADKLTVSGAITAPGKGLLLQGAGAFELGNSANALSSLATVGAIGSLDLVNSSALQVAPVQVGAKAGSGIQTAGAIRLRNTGDLTLTQGSTVQSSAGAIDMRNTGTLTLASGSEIKTDNGALVLQAGRLVNQAGAQAVVSGGGNAWQIWSTNPAPYDPGTGDQPGALPHDFVQYNAGLGQTAIAGTGRGLLYQYAPELTIDLLGPVSKIYDANTSSALERANYKVAFLNQADGVGVNRDELTLHNFSQGVYSSNGTGATPANAGTGKLVIASGLGLTAENSGRPVYGYTAPTTTSAAIGQIEPKVLDLNITKVYDGKLGFDNAARDIVFTGMVGTQAQPRITAGTANISATPVEQSIAPVGVYQGFVNPQVLQLSDPNYVLVRGATVGQVVATIVKAPLGVTVEGNYSGTTEIIKPTAFTTTGLVNGETLTALSKFTVKFREVSANDVNYVTELFSGGGTAVLSNYDLTLAPSKLPGDTQNMVKIKALSDIIVSLPKWPAPPVKPLVVTVVAPPAQSVAVVGAPVAPISSSAPSAPAAVQSPAAAAPAAAAPAAATTAATTPPAAATPAAVEAAAPAPSPVAAAASDGPAAAAPAASAASQGETAATTAAGTSGGSSATEETGPDGKPRAAAAAPGTPEQTTGAAPVPAQAVPGRAAQATGVSLAVVTQATAQVSGLVNVVVPAPAIRGAAAVVVPLPTTVVQPATPAAGVRATLSNDRPLPGWIKYDAAQRALVVESTPATALPVTVILNIGGQRTSIVVSESLVPGR